MAPTQERFSATNAIGADVDLGLIVQLQLTQLDRPAQIVLQRHALVRGVRHFQRVETIAAAARRLRTAQGHLGPAQQNVEGVAVERIHADAHGQRGMNIERGDHERLAHRFGNLVHERFGVAGTFQLTRDDGELVARQSREHVVVTEHRPQSLRQPEQQLIAGLVTERVVDGLEPIDVEDDDGKLVAAVLGIDDGLGSDGGCGASGGQAGQIVGAVAPTQQALPMQLDREPGSDGRGRHEDREQRQIRQPVLKSPLHVDRESSCPAGRGASVEHIGHRAPGLSAWAQRTPTDTVQVAKCAPVRTARRLD